MTWRSDGKHVYEGDRLLATFGHPADAEYAADTVNRIAAVYTLMTHAKQVFPSDRMTVYVGDLEQALGLSVNQACTRTGSNDGSSE